MAVEDVVVAFAGRTGPNMSQSVTKALHVIEVTEQDLVVDARPEVSRREEVNRVQVGNVNSSSVWRRTFGPVFLNVHAEEADVNSVDLFVSEQRPGSVGEVVLHLVRVDKPKEMVCLQSIL